MDYQHEKLGVINFEEITGNHVWTRTGLQYRK